MKKIIIGAVIGIILFAAFGAAGYAFALFMNPSSRYEGYGMMGPRGGMMGNRADRNEYGRSAVDVNKIHESMISALAEKLSLSSVDLQSRLDKGETLTQIVSSAGIDSSKLETLVTEAHSAALDQAVKDGTLTQTQADWMKQRGSGMMFGSGRGGLFSDGRDCPCLDGDDEK